MHPTQKPQGCQGAWRVTAGAAILVMAFGTNPAFAAGVPEVRGDVAEMQLRADEATIREVLAALAGSFKLTYTLPPGVNRAVSGLYSGSLRQVLARILDGTNYIIREIEGGAEVVVLGPAGVTSVSAPVAVEPVAIEVAKPINEAAAAAVPALSSFR